MISARRDQQAWDLVFRASGGLRTRDGAAPAGFHVAGADGRFKPAVAELKGDRVRVWSPEVTAPTAVRHGWVDNPSQTNLVDADGLPAVPFRTDTFRWITAGKRFSP